MKLRPIRFAERGRKPFSGPRLHASLFRLAILLFLFCFAAIPLSAQDKRHFNILLIFSEHTASEIRTDLTGAYFNELANLGIMFESDLVELDSLHDQNQTSWDEKLSPKKEAIEAGKYKLIVTFGEPATNTLKNILPIVPESTAVILSNMKTFPEEWRQIHPNTTAVIRQMDPRTNIKFGLKLFPNNPHVVLLVSPFGWSDRQDMTLRNEFAGICDFTTVYISDTEREAAFRKLAAAPADAFIVANDWDIYLPSIGSRSTIWYQLMQVRDDLPIIGRRRVLLDFAIGGYMSSIEEVGKKTAALTGQLANARGSSPAAKIAPVVVDEACVINYKRINYWEYDKEAIPADAEWVNRPQSWTERNQDLLITLAILFTVLWAFFLGILIYFLKYRHMTSRFLAIHGHMPLLVAAYSTSGEVLYSHVPFNDPDASQNLDDLRT
ncbi:MAG: hypothetical protein J6W70_01680, partial [Lentisphaeria bacterium]|nr:hypothetical protein [Lentisphaeria bacterium]